MHSLHCAPVGASRVDAFISRLQQEGVAAKKTRTALMLPSPYLLEQARTRLRQTDLAGWEFPGLFSMDELAAKLSGFRKISRVEQELILTEILAELKNKETCACFADIAEFPGFVAALARLFDEFKMAAATPDELAAVMEGMAEAEGHDGTRDAAIALLFDRYQEKLIEYSLVDIAGTYLLAVEALEKPETALPFQRLLIAEFSILSPMRLQFIAGLQRRVPVEISIYYEKDRPAIYAAVEPVVQSLAGMGFVQLQQPVEGGFAPALRHLQQQLYAENPVIMETAPELKILLSPTRAKEIALVADQVKSALLESALQPGDIALVVRDPGLYSQLGLIFAERGIPLDAPQSVAASERACFQLMFAWLNLLGGSGSRDEVMAVVKSPFMRAKLAWDADRLEQCLLSAVIRSWGDWETAIVQQAPDAATAQLWQDCLREIRLQLEQWVDGAMFAGFAAWTEWLDMPGVLRQCRRAGSLDLAEVRAELAVWQMILAAVEELATMFSWLRPGNQPVRPHEFASLLRRMLQGVRVDISDRQEQGVQLVTPGTASGMRYSLVFILGLTEGEFPAQPRESWLYGDADRRLFGELGLQLSTAAGRSALEDFYFALSIAMATEKLVLSAVTDSEKLPSRYLNEVTRLFAAEAIATETAGIEQIVVDRPDLARSKPELIRAALRHRWQSAVAAQVWQEVYAAIRADFPAQLEERAGIECNRMAAFAGEVAAELVVKGRFSASALERYALCPFAYFVTDVLGLDSWEAADEGMDALSAGSIWHEILAGFMAQYRGEKLQPAALDAYAADLTARLDQIVRKKERQGRIVPGIWWQYERPRWEKALRQWLVAELSRQSGTPATPQYFEWSFGMPARPDSDVQSSPEPLCIGRDGQRVELQGKVDRIDADAAQLRVIDYKSGQLPTNKQVQQGVCLQAPVYMMAAQALLGPEVSCREGLYVPVGREGRDFVLPGKKLSQEEMFDLTSQYVLQWADRIRDGQFPAQPAIECASYCPTASFCRRSEAAEAEESEELQDE
jgi:ATP-dependent helicase/DNAse subunit B